MRVKGTSMSRRAWIGSLPFVLAGVCACGSNSAHGLPGDDDASDAGMPGAPGDAAADDSGLPGVFTGSDAGDATGPSGCVTCSSDLHQVLDCATNQVLRTCAANTGCGLAGTCVAPCDSAAANQSSIGCEYYVLNPDGSSPVPDFPDTVSAAGSCFAAFVANTWTSPVSIGLEFDGQSLDAASSAYIPQGSGAALTYAPLTGGQLAPGQLAIVFLADYSSANSSAIPCPSSVHPAYTAGDAAVHGTGRGHAYHLTTSAPVVAYDIYPYGGKVSNISSATLLLPTSAWDTNYVSVAAYAGEPDKMFDMNIAFVASQDATTITINPAAAIVSGPGVAAAPQGAPATYTLNSGESIQFEQLDDLSGSLVLADKPIAAWGGHWSMDIPINGGGVDAAHQQLPPVKAWGHEYAAVRYRDRTGQGNESVPWRLAGAVNGTILTYTPQTPAGAPTSLARGQIVEFNSPGPLVIASQDAAHPFYLAGHMTSGSIGVSGDPETVNVVPPAQYLDHYVFFTDPTYGETNLVVVRDHTLGRDVTIDCQSGPLTGWQPIGTKYETTRIDLQHLGAKVGDCDNGRHEMKSSAPFGLTVWGWDEAVSYAYPAGASVKPINSVVVTPNPPK
jgi:IgGFc binding protein